MCVQVVDKELPAEYVLRDSRASELYVQDRLERVSTHALLSVLVTQLQGCAISQYHEACCQRLSKCAP